MYKFVIAYLSVINIVGFFLMGLDKAKAKKGAWRISEKTLLLTAVFGGSIGSWLGMETFRHKTKHWYFKYGIPFIFLVQIIITIALIFYM